MIQSSRFFSSRCSEMMAATSTDGKSYSTSHAMQRNVGQQRRPTFRNKCNQVIDLNQSYGWSCVQCQCIILPVLPSSPLQTVTSYVQHHPSLSVSILSITPWKGTVHSVAHVHAKIRLVRWPGSLRNRLLAS